MKRCSAHIPVAAAEVVAEEPGGSRASLYPLIERYRATGPISRVNGERRRPALGNRDVERTGEALILDVFEPDYPTPTPLSFRHTVENNCLNFRRDGLHAPPDLSAIIAGVVSRSAVRSLTTIRHRLPPCRGNSPPGHMLGRLVDRYAASATEGSAWSSFRSSRL